ncbi:uncharacterized protein I303_107326 [Kwoniella dejecticola CBS 10117]|uniref:Conserved oligomeric Golgi complex subunit 2 n=1 Tax=Kwoniella dejecticola CBS 10117 TaxID=1296121 RepID=A0A1A5ZZD1_9TREE|nr:uncharacterized protein I303_06731 [Kwoniella dejecticola CBS 10117]OBR83172.1 hypothetical protein I303_06731 [Kwoniella dejecticola CBS 10117]
MTTMNGNAPRGMSISISPTSVQPSTVPPAQSIPSVASSTIDDQPSSSSRRRSPSSSSSSSSSSSRNGSVILPSLEPLSHNHPLLTSENYNADEFLLSRLHIPLEELRGELREYLNELKEELVKLINEDYEEFISLGTGLRGEEGRLKGLQGPMVTIRNEIEGVRDVLLEHQQKVQSKLDERSALREEKALLDLLQRLFDTLTRAETLLDTTPDEEHGSAKMITRVAGEYTQVVYLLNKARAEDCAIVDIVEERIDKIKSRLSKDLATLLTAELAEPSIPRLKQCLRTYELIEGWEEAEGVVRQAVRSYCRATITPSCLTVPTTPTAPKTPHSASNPLDKSLRLPLEYTSPLASLYNTILGQMETYQPLLQIADDISEKFGFFAKIIWTETATALIDNLGSTIFAAGRPDELHKHYTTTHKFMDLLEQIAPSTRNVLAMRTSPSYETFERRWQLPVYFQLRWKEIVGTLEAALNGAGNDRFATTGGDWAMNATAGIWAALQTTWSDDVFIDELAPRFWRLSLQIIARHGTYLRTTLETFSIGEEDTAQEDAALKFAASAIVDLDRLKIKVSEIETVTSLGLTEHLTLPITPYSTVLLQILTRRCTDPLKLIRSIASQFRASPSPGTNAQQKPQASYFVPNVLRPLHTLYTSYPALKEQYGVEWNNQILDTVLVNYSSILGSVKKTEDLLRKHRKSKKNNLTSFFSSSNASTDATGENDKDKEEERFRNQMVLDMNTLKEDAKSLQVKVEGLSSWRELVDVVNRPAE